MIGRARSGWQFRLTHALDKIYPDWSPTVWSPTVPAAPPELSVFLGETASFQIAVRPGRNTGAGSPLRVSVNVADAPHLRVHGVDLVPCDLAAFPGHDDGYDRDQPGWYPDLLRPLIDGAFAPVIGAWTALWVDFRVDDPELAGFHEVEITISDASGELLHRSTVTIRVIGIELPPLPIANTHWFHCDGLAQFYGVGAFSAEHWQLIEAFVGSASRMQVNTLLTPVWTPPLDTEIGGHRLPTQLLDITYRDGSYAVDFARLDSWLDMCRRHGIERLEMPHLFTQWGAAATPSIYVNRAGQLVEEFGWHIGATDPRYRHFLEQVLPELKAHLADRWGLDRVIFHISDEPHGPDQLASYLRAKSVVEDLIAPCAIIDALSDAEFYGRGAVPNPVVATDAVEPFLARGTRPLWVYYCVGQNRAVSNRFFALPSSRNRVIGHQLFAFDCAGFLHWGFNFYNSELSRRPVDPFQDTTASGAFLGGDAFMVYPGDDGQPLESIRYKVFTQAMFDLRAFHRLSELSGRDAVLELIDTDGRGGRLRFDAFSSDPQHYLGVRQEINRRIVAAAR